MTGTRPIIHTITAAIDTISFDYLARDGEFRLTLNYDSIDSLNTSL